MNQPRSPQRHLGALLRLLRFSARERGGDEGGVNRIEVLVRGGLGNQLFGFAAGMELAERLGLPLHLTTAMLHAEGVTPRDFELGTMGTEGLSWGSESAVANIFRETKFSYEEAFGSIRGPILLDGYFQSPKYFSTSEESVRSAIGRAADFERGRSFTSQDFIGLQVRRGDYLNPAQSSYHGVIPASFFNHGASFLRALVGPLPVVVFSDSPGEAESIASQIVDAVPHAPGPGVTPLEALGSLSQARALCISNSSFGWWGGFLAGPEVPVLAPRPWFRNRGVDTTDLLPSHWLTLGYSDNHDPV